MDIKNSILDYTRYKQLNWYDHMRKNEDRLHRKVLEWFPPGRRIKGRFRNQWMMTRSMRLVSRNFELIENLSLFHLFAVKWDYERDIKTVFYKLVWKSRQCCVTYSVVNFMLIIYVHVHMCKSHVLEVYDLVILHINNFLSRSF